MVFAADLAAHADGLNHSIALKDVLVQCLAKLRLLAVKERTMRSTSAARSVAAVGAEAAPAAPVPCLRRKEERESVASAKVSKSSRFI